MSLLLQHAFLSRGKPLHDASHFESKFALSFGHDELARGDTFDSEAGALPLYAQWEVLLLVAGRWCTDVRMTKIRPAVAVAIVGVAQSAVRQLLYCSVLESVDPSAAAEEAWQALNRLAASPEEASLRRKAAASPSTFLPKAITARYFTAAPAIDRALAGGARTRESIEQELRGSLQRRVGSTSALRDTCRVESGPHSSPLLVSTDEQCAEIIAWMCDTRGMFPDVSVVGFTVGQGESSAESPEAAERRRLEDELFRIAAEVPLLSRCRLHAPPQSAGEQRDAAVPDDGPTNPLVVGMFTIPDEYLDGPSPPTEHHPLHRHVVLLQRPSYKPPPQAASSRGGEEDLPPPGPVQPQPTGVEFHLFCDRGDAEHIHATLSKPFASQVFEDLLHAGNEPPNGDAAADTPYQFRCTDGGEVFLQFAPVEGSSTRDAARAIRAAERDNGDGNDVCAGEVGSGSQFRVAVPRCTLNVPTGKSERRTPVEPSKMGLSSRCPDNAMLRCAVAAAKFLVEKLLVAGDAATAPPGHYALDWAAMKAAAATVTSLSKCHFCARRRERMSRCSACRVAHYCCKSHQAQDWKGGHAKECKLLLGALESYYDGEPGAAPLLPVLEPAAQREIRRERPRATRLAPETAAAIHTDIAGAALREAERPTPARAALRVEARANARSLLAALGLSRSPRPSLEAFPGLPFGSAVLAQCCRRRGLPFPALLDSVEAASDAPLTARAAAFVVHLLHVEDHSRFLAELAAAVRAGESLPALASGRVQLRLLVVNCPSVAPAEQNQVFGLQPSSAEPAFELVPKTGALGDAWHEHPKGAAPNPAATASILVRLYHDRYHNMPANASLSAGSATANKSPMTPDAVVSLGGRQYSGSLSFFAAAAEVFADDLLAHVPVILFEPHHVSASKSLTSVLSRANLTPANKTLIAHREKKSSKSKAAAAGPDFSELFHPSFPPGTIYPNAQAVSPIAVREWGNSGETEIASVDELVARLTDDDTVTPPVVMASVPLYLNAFCAVFLPCP